MNAALPFAEQMLQKSGEFFPYGTALKTAGGIANVAGYDGRERPPSLDVIRLLKQGFVQGAKSGEYKATALVYDVRVVLPSSGKKSDAVAVSLNHREGYSVVVMFPYQMRSCLNESVNEVHVLRQHPYHGQKAGHQTTYAMLPPGSPLSFCKSAALHL